MRKLLVIIFFSILSTTLAGEEFPTNREFVGYAVDSLVARFPIPPEIDTLSIDVQSSYPEIEDMLFTSLCSHLISSGKTVAKGSGNVVTVGLKELLFSYPRAYCRHIFGQKLLERKVYIRVFYTVESGNSLLRTQEVKFALTDTIPYSIRSELEGEPNSIFTPEIKRFSPSFYYRELFLSTTAAILLSTLFFLSK
ncbi:hypothetical protein J7K18_08675 [bacterium]|nr:hypothetical protein [bacterium]